RVDAKRQPDGRHGGHRPAVGRAGRDDRGSAADRMTSGRDGRGLPDDPRSPDDPWLPIGAAARLVGVGPDTLRRWADGGKVQSYQTAGGHRLFLRSSLEAMTSTPRRTRYVTVQLADASTTIIFDRQRRIPPTGSS